MNNGVSYVVHHITQMSLLLLMRIEPSLDKLWEHRLPKHLICRPLLFPYPPTAAVRQYGP